MTRSRIFKKGKAAHMPSTPPESPLDTVVLRIELHRLGCPWIQAVSDLLYTVTCARQSARALCRHTLEPKWLRTPLKNCSNSSPVVGP
mmetsp:Transcript_18502/g.14980  ORF Transcript_18502/g.14980 Transcript_18502/m.14980 type:complete len:88 (+) Transcript_18502:53-316(+)